MGVRRAKACCSCARTGEREDPVLRCTPIVTSTSPMFVKREVRCNPPARRFLAALPPHTSTAESLSQMYVFPYIRLRHINTAGASRIVAFTPPHMFNTHAPCYSALITAFVLFIMSQSRLAFVSRRKSINPLHVCSLRARLTTII